MAEFTIRRPTDDKDFATIVGLWNGAQGWPHERGSNRWHYPLRTTNRDLHRYYLDSGFRLVRIASAPDIISGALFSDPPQRR